MVTLPFYTVNMQFMYFVNSMRKTKIKDGVNDNKGLSYYI